MAEEHLHEKSEKYIHLNCQKRGMKIIYLISFDFSV